LDAHGFLQKVLEMWKLRHELGNGFWVSALDAVQLQHRSHRVSAVRLSLHGEKDDGA